MRNVIFGLVSLALMMACMGTTARKEVLMRSMLLTWQSSIAESVQLGGGDPSGMQLALESGDPKKVLEQPWGTLREQALAGIQRLLDEGSIGINVMTIMTNELAMFDRAMLVLGGHLKVDVLRAGRRSADVVVY